MDNNEVLSEAEVDALMEGADGNESAAGSAAPGEVVEYDFTAQDHIVRGRMPVLERINERFAQNFQQGLYSQLQRTAEISAAPLRNVRFAEFVNSLEVPASLNSISMRQLQGSALLVLEAGLIDAIVDLFFGGSGHCQGSAKAREFSATEQRVIQLLLEKLVVDLQAAWAPVMAIDFENLETGIDLQFASPAGANDVLVVCSFHVDLEGVNGAFHIALPMSALDPISDLLDGGLQNNQSGSQQQLLDQLKRNLQQASVGMSAILLETELKLREVLDLKVGDVIPVEIPEQATLYTEGVAMFCGHFGIHNGKNSVKVTMRTQDPEKSQRDK